jgi:SAM-dependent methyltransferase
MNNAAPEETNDYRKSHLHRGVTYDANIAADPFDAYMAELERQHLNRIINSLFPYGIPRYLDFACGTGRITQTIAALAKEAVGVDISPSMIENAKQKCPEVRFINEDLTKNRPAIGQFDLVSSFRFFGNAQPDLRHQVLSVLFDLVKPGGYLVVNNHRNPNSLAAVFHRLTGGKMDMDLTHSMFQEMLAKYGFCIVQRYPIGAWLFRSRMLASIGWPNETLLRRERLFGHPMFTSIAPDAILVARRNI